MRTIWKYQIEEKDKFTISMPIGAEIIRVQTKIGIPFIWALVDTEKEFEDREFEIYGTGYLIKDSNNKYIGSFYLREDFIFHLFEKEKSNIKK